MNEKCEIQSREDQAIAWFFRLQDCDDEETWIAHRDWLEANAANAAAYAAVERVWIETEALPAHVASSNEITAHQDEAGMSGTVVDLADRRAAVTRRRALVWIPTAVAAALVAMVAVPQIDGIFPSSGTVYRTDARGTREVVLADGSVMTLNRNTEATVRIEGNERSVVLASGQVAFDVRHDATRPFTIAAGGRQVRVLGTAFDVMTRDGAFGVSVSRGLVSVSQPKAPGDDVKLPAGRALLRLPGQDRDQIVSVDPDNALAWKDGRLVYLDSDLGTVARDYERYIGKPVSVAPDVARLRISGVVKARDENDLIRQLEELLPVRIVRTSTGREIVKR